MHIELVLTGGTIGSISNEKGALDTRDGTPSTDLINYLYEKQPSYRELTEFNISTPIDTLSENMTLLLWNKLIDHIKKIDRNKTDGIIITHGTDTVAYTANLLALLLDGIDMPVFFVSSSKPLSDPKANGYDNFNKAVDVLIEGIGPGIHIPYKNRDGQMNVHSANRLIQCQDLSPDFESAHHKLNNIQKIRFALIDEKGLDPDTALINQLSQIKGNILTINPQPGLDYRNYDLDYVDAVLHGTYHSSTMAADTANDENSVLFLKQKCIEKGIPMYFAPVLSGRKQIYSSTYEIIQQGVIPIYDMTIEMAYIYLILKTSVYE